MNNLQGSDEWFAARLGKVTSSRIKDVMAKGRGNAPSAARQDYMTDLALERITGVRDEGYTNAIMQRGIDLEPLAKSAYEIATGNTVEDVGFIPHEVLQTGSSPDGLVNIEGMVEVKCPKSKNHWAVIQSGKADPQYHAQMQHQMWIAEREWNDFVSFDDRFPEPLQLFVARVMRDELYIEKMVAEIAAFINDLDKLESDMRGKM